MQTSTSSETLVNGNLPGQRNFDWRPEHLEILERIAATNAVSNQWNELRNMLMYRIAENLATLPARSVNTNNAIRRSSIGEDAHMQDVTTRSSSPLPGPIEAPIASTSSPTSSSSPSAGPSALPSTSQQTTVAAPQNDVEDAERQKEDLQQQVWDALDGFESEPPFTIQRLAELAINPTKHYTTAIKYLRALQRTLKVSSVASAYVADTYALSPGPAETSMLGHASTTSSNSTTSPMLRSSPSPSSSPLLSPIPWITQASSSFEDSESDEMMLGNSNSSSGAAADGSSSSPHVAAVNGHDSSLAEGGSPQLPAISPTGGRVDELDPLPPSQASPQASGMAEHPEPITDPQGSPPRNSKSPDLAGSPPHAHNARRPSF